MKLLFANRKPRPYGNFSIESYVESLIPHLAREVEVISWQAPFFSNGILPRLKSIWKLSRVIRKTSPAVTHVTGDTHFLMWGIPIGKRVLTIHDVGFLNRVRGFRYWLLRYFWLSGPVAKADAVTCVSEETRREIMRHLRIQKPIHVIPTVIDPGFLPQQRDFNQSCPTILLLGSAPNKNLHRVLESTRGLKVQLSLIARLDEKAIELLSGQSYEVCESIPFETLLQKYRDADIVALCSTLEGFGMPILEAQATGRVVLTSNCSSMPEVAGDGALLVDPYSVAAIREGITRLIEDDGLRNKLIQAGFENVKRFQPALVAQQYLSLYRQLVKNNNAAA